MANTAMNGISRTTGLRYDVSQHASEGGRASGLSRRLRPQRAIEESILVGGNNMAKWKVLEVRRLREAELLAEELRRDKEILAMDEMLADAREELRSLDAQVSELEAKLERSRSDPQVLKECLQAAGEDAVERALLELRWIEVA
jgi:hypothetical protein